jgi:imidazolonepropionase
MPPLLLTNIGQLVTARGSTPRRGAHLGELHLLNDAAVLCAGGKIVSVGTRRDARRDPWLKSQRKKIREIDCRGGVVLPGFVDSHTHPAFAAPRLVDFEKRIAGGTYEQITQAGGGIRSSLEGVRKRSRTALAQKVLSALREMAAQGTTTVECKSGYGLSLEAELKSLEAIRAAARQWPGTVLSTLLGAHVVPAEYLDRREDYVRLVCEEMVPAAARRKLAQFVDVFVERGAFSIDETHRIFFAARQHGLGTRAHMCQLTTVRMEPLLKFEPASLDHMDYVSDDELRQLAQRDTVATLLPGANYFLGLDRYPPARKLIDAGVPVALATDYNPGSSPLTSMQFVLSLACTHMKMSPAEAVAAATINGAAALGLAGRKGTIEPGKDADLAAFGVRDYREIAYWFGSNLCGLTVLQGNLWELSPREDV